MKIKLILCFCCLLTSLFCGETRAQNNNVEKAKELWEKVIAAKGGRENLYAVKTLVVSNKTYSPTDKKIFRNMHIVDFFVLSGKWWAWQDQRPGFSLGILQYDFEKEIGQEVSELSSSIRIYKPEKSQDVSKRNSEIILDGSRFNNTVKQDFLENQLIYLMETKWFQPKIESSRTERISDKDFEVVVVSFGRVRIEYFIDPKTYLPNKIKKSVWFEDTKRFGAEDGFYLEDYIEVKGIKFPQAIKRGKKTDSKITYYVNEPYNENLFNNPPSIKAGADAWKPQKSTN